MHILEKIPGEDFAQSGWDDTYLRPGKHPRRCDIVHEIYEEPAIAEWRKADEARRSQNIGTAFGNAGVPKRKGG